MKDTIYREDAIRAVCKGCIKEFKECAHHWSCPKLNELAAVPSADRPQGEWIDKGWKGDWQFETDGRGHCWKVFECSVCNGWDTRKTHFCPNCGARMKGASDD